MIFIVCKNWQKIYTSKTDFFGGGGGGAGGGEHESYQELWGGIKQ